MHKATLIALLGVVAGVVVGEKFSYGSVVATVFFFVGVMSLIVSYFEHKHKVYRKESNVNFLSLFLGILCITFVVTIIRTQFEEEKNIFVCESVCTFQAQVSSSPKEQGPYQILSVLPQSTDNTFYVQIKIPLYPKFKIGDRVTITGKTLLPHLLLQHDDKKTFDYASYLALHDIGSEMLYPKIVYNSSSEKSENIFSYAEQIKENFVNTISVHVDEPAASLASGMLFGDQSMSQNLIQTFRTTGLSHIIVVSGFNIAVLISFILFVCMIVPLVMRVSFAFLLIIFFVCMVGVEMSIIRATLMSSIALLALLVGRAYSAKQALLISFMIIILYEPKHLLSDVSLHLSFLATAGIIYLQESLSIFFQKIQSKTYREIMGTTAAAYIATLPYIMYTFGTVSVYALITNIVVLPLVPLVMLVTFFIVTIAPVSEVLAMCFGYVDTLVCDGIIFVAKVFERFPFASVPVSVSGVTMFTLYAGIGLFFYGISKRKNNETLLTKDDENISQIIAY